MSSAFFVFKNFYVKRLCVNWQIPCDGWGTWLLIYKNYAPTCVNILGKVFLYLATCKR